MIKKRILSISFLLLLLFQPALSISKAENIPSIRDTVNAGINQFSFRNGIHWGMNEQQVQNTEQINMERYYSGEWSVMISSIPVEVSRFTADLVFMFYKGTLKMITYEFQSDETSFLNYHYLTGALCSVYGESSPAEASTIKKYMDYIYPDRYNIDYLTHAFGWNAADGTLVFQYYYTDNCFAILYIDPSMNQQKEGYAVNGL